MARNKSALTIQAEYLPARGLLRLLQILPYAVSKRLCRGLLHGLMVLLHEKRQLMGRQLTASFPDRSPAQIQAIARECIDHVGDGIATFARMPIMDRREMESLVETEGFEHMEKVYAEGKGLISMTGHFGCWEFMAVYVASRYPRVSALVRPLDNRRIDALVTRIRQSGGGGVIDSRRVFKDGLRHLRRNGQLGILMDQNFYKGGVFVDFFGRPAATNTLVSLLARRTGCAVLPIHNVWRGGKIRIICEPPMALSEKPDTDQAIIEDTQAMTRIIERWVRDDPAQWFWLHNRWKRVPQPGEPVYSF